MHKDFFSIKKPIEFKGLNSKEVLSFKYYNPEQVILGKTMKEHLRFCACYWHNFVWQGNDQFGSSTFEHFWHNMSDPMEKAKAKADIAFHFFHLLGVPYFAFHDFDAAPEGASFKESQNNLNQIVDIFEQKMQEYNINLLWGTANLFSHSRFMSGAATNPNPDVFAYSAARIKHMMDITKRLNGENYVIWGGREGYETLLNTNLKTELDHMGRMLCMAVDYKHKIGFKGPILIEPKPQEPTKHQYDYDVATVYGFLKKYDLLDDVKVNIEANHATLAGHSFHHEVEMAFALNIFGSLDINRGDAQLGWDTDQFPTDFIENSLVLKSILENGGIKTGGFNFDAKLRRQSIDADDLLIAHIGGMDNTARSLINAAKMIEDGYLDKQKEYRYIRWNDNLGQDIENNKHDFVSLEKYVLDNNVDPKPKSGKQELLENYILNTVK